MRRLIGTVLVAMLTLASVARAQEILSIPFSVLSQASNNSTLVYGENSLLKTIIVINTTATQYYLKIYNKRTAPTCGTDTPVLRIPIPQVANGGGVVEIATEDMKFPLGIGFCLTGGLADNDNSNAATGIAINFGYSYQ